MTVETSIFLAGMILCFIAFMAFWAVSLKRIFEKKSEDKYACVTVNASGYAKIVLVDKTDDDLLHIPKLTKKMATPRAHKLSQARRLIMSYPQGLPAWFRAPFETYIVNADDGEVIDPWQNGEPLVNSTAMGVLSDNRWSRNLNEETDRAYNSGITRKGTKWALVMIGIVVIAVFAGLGYLISQQMDMTALNTEAINSIKSALGVK